MKIRGRKFHNWAWITLGKRRVGFCLADWSEDSYPWTTRGMLPASPRFFGVRIPLTRYYLSTYRKP